MALTFEEFKTLRDKGLSIQQISNFESGYVPGKSKSVEGFIPDVKESISERSEKLGEIADRYSSGEQGLASSALQTAGQAAGALGDIVYSGVKNIGKALLPKKAEEKIGQTITGAVQKVVETKPVQSAINSYQEWKSKHPEAAYDLEAVANISSILPNVKVAGTTGKILSTAAAPIAKTIGETVSTTGRAVEGLGKTVYKSAITPTVKEAEKIIAYEAKTPFLTRASNVLLGKSNVAEPLTRGTTAFEKGIKGTEKMIGVGAKRQSKELWKSTIQPAVAESSVRLTPEDLFFKIEERIGKTLEPGKKKAYEEAYEAIKDDYKALKDVSLEDAQKIKSELDEFTPEKMFKGKNVANEYTVLKNDIADAIRKKTYEALEDVNIKKDYLDWANLHELEKVGVKAITSGGLKGGFGNFWSTMWDKLTVPVKTVGGRALYRVGNLFEFVGDKGIKKFGDFLKKQGFKLPE